MNEEEVIKIIDLYINQEMSLRQISQLFNCSRDKIKNVLINNAIEIRPFNYHKYYDKRSGIKENIPYRIDAVGYYRKGKIRQHRSIMEKHLNRQLTSEEIVHHIDRNRLNNSIENLFVFPSNSIHRLYHNKYFIENMTPQEFLDYYNNNLKQKIENYKWLYYQYITLDKSCNQLSKELNISRNTITKILKDKNIYALRKPTIN